MSVREFQSTANRHWHELPAAQQPAWPDPRHLDAVLAEISRLPPLVLPSEARALQAALGQVACGRGFLLQAGDCVESFSTFSARAISAKVKLILQMAMVLTYGSGVPVVTVGRIAGQFAKPRSAMVEQVEGIELPVFRGDMVNAIEPTRQARRPDPDRILRGYHQAAVTLNLLRAFTRDGFSDLRQVHRWNLDFVARSPAGRRYAPCAYSIDQALNLVAAWGIPLSPDSLPSPSALFTSHEALLLGFEQAMTRQDSPTPQWYDTSAHLLWLGDRTRQLDGAHVAFLSGIRNPLAVKLGPTATPEQVVALCDRLDPQRVPGRLTLITRLGSTRVQELLPPLLHAVRGIGHPVVWVCDPMHGNTFRSPSGRKTRHFDDIMAELGAFFEVHRAEGTHPGGIHVELTGDQVTECLGGAEEILDEHLRLRYETACDPRLNADQSLELAFQATELLRRSVPSSSRQSAQAMAENRGRGT
jgi:3-deoxy-7-phosphoheptulonate synthase